jgi:photosystem II stability/assembly factor-like uncharacterized protein
MKYVISSVVLFFLVCVQGTKLNAQWNTISIGEDQAIQRLDVVNSSKAYALIYTTPEENLLSFSVDGGLSWEAMNFPDTLNQFNIIAMNFYAENEGVVFYRDWGFSGSPALVLQTVDNGDTWKDITPDDAFGIAYPNAIQFLNNEIGFIAVGSGLFKTNDGGESWTVATAPSYIRSIDFIDENNGVIGLFDGSFAYIGGMYCTSDGGATWQGTFLSSSHSVVNKVRMINENFVIAVPRSNFFGSVDQLNEVYVSNDKGLSWLPIPYVELEEDQGLMAAAFKNENEWKIGIGDWEQSKVYKTEDGGLTWNLEIDLPDYALGGICLTETSEFLYGDYGSYYMSTIPTSTNGVINNQVKAFPNPVRSGNPLQFSVEDDYQVISIINLSGQLVFEQNLDASNSIIVPELKSGIYSVSLKNDYKTAITKVYVLKE